MTMTNDTAVKTSKDVVRIYVTGDWAPRFGLKPDYPMTAPNYTQQRREVALATGLGRPKKTARRGRRPGPRPRPADQDQQAGNNARA